MGNSIEPISIRVAGASEIKRAEDAARHLAASIGFSTDACEQIALVAVELASNLVKHATSGTLKLDTAVNAGRTGIQIESLDSGPGIADFEQAVTDGYSTAGSLGTGLGAVNRMMDELQFHSLSPGTRIVCQRWLRAHQTAPLISWLEFGAATRPYRMIRENGDTFIVKQWNGFALVGVIDGLGHGQFAQRAAQSARQYIEQHYDQPLDSLFRGVERACRATRGVVMALVRFDMARQSFALASVGNIEVRIVGSATPLRILVRRGIVGLNAPQPMIAEHPWTSSLILIMHSDGLRTHWDWQEFHELAHQSADAIARHLLLTLGKVDDDATVLVVRNART